MLLYVGKTFRIIANGSVSHAEVICIKEKFVTVLIDGEKYEMDKEKLLNRFAEYEEEKKDKNRNRCKNCMEYKKGNCYGKAQICEDFRLSPEISQKETDAWPKNADASKSKSDKFSNINREYDNMYSYY